MNTTITTKSLMVTFILLMIIGSASVGEQSDFWAQVTFIKGKVSVQTNSSNQFVPLVLGTVVHQGDRIVVGEKSRVSFLLSDGSILVGKSGQEMTLGASGKTDRQQIQNVAINLVKTLKSAPDGDPMMKHIGGLRANESNCALIPRQTRVRHDQMVQFRWTPQVQVTSYKLIIMSADDFNHEHIIKNSTAWDLPPDTLQPGRVYFWEIHDNARSNSMVPLGSGQFSTASAETVKTVIEVKENLASTYPDADPAEDSTPLFLEYQIYKSLGFSYDALETILQLQAFDPDNKTIRGMKEELMKQMDLDERHLAFIMTETKSKKQN